MAQTANPSMLHRFLGIGATVLAIAMVALRSMTSEPPVLGDMPVFAYVVSGISMVILIFTALVLTPRVPERRASQSVDAYWQTEDVVKAAMIVWFQAEGATLLSIVGYYLTGHLAVAATMVVSLCAFWWMGPNTFAKP